MNSSSAVPFAFKTYAIYDVYHKLDDTKVHNIIDTINPELRSVDNVNGKKRKREFFQMSREQAYALFESIAEISGTKDRLHLIKATENDIKDFSLLDNMFFIKKNDKYRLLKKEKEVNKKVVLRISKDEFPMEFILSKNAFKDTEGIQNLNECIERYIGNNSLLSKIRVLAIKHPFLKRILNIKTFDVEEEARYYFRMIRK